MKINNRFAIGLASALLAATFAFGTTDVVPCFAQDNAPAAVAVENTETEAPVADAATDEAAQVEEQAEANAETASDRAPFFGFFGLLWVLSLAGSIAALVFAQQHIFRARHQHRGTGLFQQGRQLLRHC